MIPAAGTRRSHAGSTATSAVACPAGTPLRLDRTSISSRSALTATHPSILSSARPRTSTTARRSASRSGPGAVREAGARSKSTPSPLDSEWASVAPLTAGSPRSSRRTAVASASRALATRTPSPDCAATRAPARPSRSTVTSGSKTGSGGSVAPPDSRSAVIAAASVPSSRSTVVVPVQPVVRGRPSRSRARPRA